MNLASGDSGTFFLRDRGKTSLFFGERKFTRTAWACLLLFSATLLITVTVIGTPPVIQSVSSPQLNTQIAVVGANQNWLSRAKAEIQAREYWMSTEAGQARAYNPTNRYFAQFTASGYQLLDIAGGQEPLVGVQLEGIGRGGAITPLSFGANNTEQARLQRQADGVTEWFNNSNAGLEQGWTLSTRPQGHGPLQIQLRFEHAKIAKTSDDAVSVTSQQQRELQYSALKVRDASGRTIAARFVQQAPQLVAIQLDDRNARYPLEIDPLWTMPPSADTTLNGLAAGDSFGYSVASAGDVNGDGFDDVIIGAYGRGSFAGSAYLFLGSATGLSTTIYQTFVGSAPEDLFGVSVAAAGDVNRDGYADVLIGASGTNGLTGSAYLYLGSATGFMSLGQSFNGVAMKDRFGEEVASVGDVNGDGYVDFIIGAPGRNNFNGSANLYLGSASGTMVASNIYNGEGGFSNFGASVASAGDVNGDGISDVIIGAYGYSNFKGRAYLYLGSTTGLSLVADQTFDGSADGDLFGDPVAPVGDVNDDGFADVIISAIGNNSRTGSASLYLGSAGGLTLAQTFVGTAPFDGLGTNVASAGDVNHDGYADFLISAVYAGFFGALPADHVDHVYLYLGSAGVTPASVDLTFNGLAAADRFGRGLAAADVNGDSFVDLLIGASGTNASAGSVNVYLNLAQINAPATQHFVDRFVGTTSSPASLTIKNSGRIPLRLGSPTFSGSNPGDFMISSNSCTSDVAPGDSCEISVTFTPSAKGPRTAKLDLPGNVPASPTVITLDGNGTLAKGEISSGGGSFDLLGLLPLLALLARRKLLLQNWPMRRLLSQGLMIILLVIVTLQAPQAQAQKALSSATVGAAAGMSMATISESKLEREINASGLHSQISNFNRNDKSFEAYLRYALTPNFALRGSLLDLGNYRATIELPPGEAKAVLKAASNKFPLGGFAVGLSAETQWQLTSSWSIQTSVGAVASIQRKINLILNQQQMAIRGPAAGLMLGLGTGYQITPSWQIGLDARAFNHNSWIISPRAFVAFTLPD
ncbi:FG-GAP-like repeat-containing protein [Stenotrophobium rhamnosiphilum]|uniref:Abnormal spindle-like microcephaly-associated protein ASH domain-containing protein n=1 Tax=Stenotrophobium rhamnosiphilum TaxID=2029166 RepID=A0A2T5MEN7_9GAMM|nr:FG-GAP-like repeat-containing protein [Stenotrophobium rhamnosiphilum]PTU31036.1 hypothetical protein CJD38_12110 [Stenotrophobium rhamnosiphilum]